MQIERIVNEQIFRNTPVQTEVRSTEEAIAAGAMALFGEKYGDRVRVVSIPGFSIELCGGTHVRATGDIGAFLIIEESGVAAGVRRIEALTGAAAVARIQEQRARSSGVVAGAQHDAAAGRRQRPAPAGRREAAGARSRAAEDEARALGRRTAGRGRRAARGRRRQGRHPARPTASRRRRLRGLSDSLRDRLGSGVVVLASENDGKVTLVVSVTQGPDVPGPGRRIVKELAPIVGGGGGGRPDFAEAGGKDPSKIDDLLKAVPDVLQKLLA